jgi:hypothetical protein
MSHIIIYSDSISPSSGTTLASTAAEPEFKVHVEYRPNDALSPADIGRQMARVQRLVNKIIEGEDV